MDPNANLEEQITLARHILKGNAPSEDADRLAELVLALNFWITGGGFLPDRWKKEERPQ